MLPALKAVEVDLGAAPVEEVLLAIIGGNEAEASLDHELLDGAILHSGAPFSRTNWRLKEAVREEERPRRAPRRPALSLLYRTMMGSLMPGTVWQRWAAAT
jgi:hypothetical protein